MPVLGPEFWALGAWGSVDFRTQFNMWAVMAAPLLISGSVLDMSNYTLVSCYHRVLYTACSLHQQPWD